MNGVGIEALELTRALFAAAALYGAWRAWRSARADLGDAEREEPRTREEARERSRRRTRMRAARRRTLSYALMAGGLLIVAGMAMADHPWLSVASNVNQVVLGVLTARLAELEIHFRESMVLLSDADRVASMAEDEEEEE